MAEDTRVQASNIVSYKERSLKAKIDPELSPQSVVEQLASAFKTPEPHSTLCLRTLDSDTLITTLNLSSAITSSLRLKLVSSPKIEALDAISAIEYALDPLTPLPSSPSGRNAVPLKMSLFNLQKFVKEDEFVEEFLARSGLKALVRLLMVRSGSEGNGDGETTRGSQETGRTGTVATGHAHIHGQGGVPGHLSGNTLAYALQGVDGIMDLESGRQGLSDDFIKRICEIITTSRNNNVYRPAASILLHLILSSPQLTSPISSKGKQPIRPTTTTPSDTSLTNGFARTYAIMSLDTACIHAIARRIEEDDLQSAGISLRVVNGLIKGALEIRDDVGNEREGGSQEDWIKRLQGDLEACKLKQAVQRLMPLHESTDLTQPIIAFQSLYLRFLLWKMSQKVDEEDEDCQRMSNEVREGMGFGKEGGTGNGLGGAGSLLGLECLARYAATERDLLDILDEQASRGDQACPVQLASDACVDILLGYYRSHSSSGELDKALEPFLLAFDRLHHLTLNAYIRIWQDSRATITETDTEDMAHVNRLTESHVRYCLAHSDRAGWYKLEQRFGEDYIAIRERYTRERESVGIFEGNEDVANLKQDIMRDVMGFMRTQRLDRMKAGTWFTSGVLFPGSPFTGCGNQPANPHRFALLSPDQKTIFWGDFSSCTVTPPPDRFNLPNTITLSSVTSLQPTTCRAISSTTQVIPSQTSFSLLCGAAKSLLDVVAKDNASWAEWIDGLRWLFAKEVGADDNDDDVGGPALEGLTKVTRKYVEAMVEAELSLRLLDLGGDRIAFASAAEVGPAPDSTAFHYA